MHIVKLIISNLKALKDWLLTMLMHGQVTVGETKQIKETLTNAHIIGGYIVKSLYGSKGWGRTKLQKSLHLLEYHCQLPLNDQTVPRTAGPFDAQIMNTLERKFRKHRHVRVDYIKVKNGKKRYNYTPTPLISEIEQLFEQYPQEKQNAINNLLSKIKIMDIERVEIASTMYAVWNNRIIKKETITDDLLLSDLYAWSRHKSVFTEASVLKVLNYMRQEGITPTGWGSYIEKV